MAVFTAEQKQLTRELIRTVSGFTVSIWPRLATCTARRRLIGRRKHSFKHVPVSFRCCAGW